MVVNILTAAAHIFKFFQVAFMGWLKAHHMILSALQTVQQREIPLNKSLCAWLVHTTSFNGHRICWAAGETSLLFSLGGFYRLKYYGIPFNSSTGSVAAYFASLTLYSVHPCWVAISSFKFQYSCPTNNKNSSLITITWSDQSALWTLYLNRVNRVSSKKLLWENWRSVSSFIEWLLVPWKLKSRTSLAYGILCADGCYCCVRCLNWPFAAINATPVYHPGPNCLAIAPRMWVKQQKKASLWSRVSTKRCMLCVFIYLWRVLTGLCWGVKLLSNDLNHPATLDWRWQLLGCIHFLCHTLFLTCCKIAMYLA